MKKGHRLVRSSKGFLFEAEDVKSPVLCRDVRGFPALLLHSKNRSEPNPGRLLLVVPDLAMEEWLARWSEDTRPRRRVTITRRTDGSQVRLTASLFAYGVGGEPSICVERVERDSLARPVAAEPKPELAELSLRRRTSKAA